VQGEARVLNLGVECNLEADTPTPRNFLRYFQTPPPFFSPCPNTGIPSGDHSEFQLLSGGARDSPSMFPLWSHRRFFFVLCGPCFGVSMYLSRIGTETTKGRIKITH
jgi:hypothetical protein